MTYVLHDGALTCEATVLKPARSRMLQGKGPPSFCWHCGKQLQRAKGKGKGLFYFNLVRDMGGVEHRVHGFPCTQLSIEGGDTFIAGAKP